MVKCSRCEGEFPSKKVLKSHVKTCAVNVGNRNNIAVLRDDGERQTLKSSSEYLVYYEDVRVIGALRAGISVSAGAQLTEGTSTLVQHSNTGL